MQRYDRLGNNPTESEQRQIAFSQGRRREPNEPYTSSILLPPGYVRHSIGCATHQDYQPQRGSENLPLRNYREYIWTCKTPLRRIKTLLESLYEIYETFTTKVYKYMNEDTSRTRSDPNNNVYLSIHRGNLLIQDLKDARRHINDIIEEDIEAIRVAQADLGLELPENYSAPWHLDPDERRLINNDTGYYQDP